MVDEVSLLDIFATANSLACDASKVHLLALVLKMVFVLVNIHVVLLTLRVALIRSIVVALVLQVANIFGVTQNFWTHFLNLAPEFIFYNTYILLVLLLTLRLHQFLMSLVISLSLAR